MLFFQEKFQIFEAGTEFACLDAVDDGGDFFVHRRRAADFPAEGGNGAVDGIDLGLLALFDILQHAGLEFCMLPDGDGQNQQRKGLHMLYVAVDEVDPASFAGYIISLCFNYFCTILCAKSAEDCT